MEHAVRTLLHLPVEIATAFFFAASIGIGAGVVATSYTHRLGDGLKMALVAFLVGGRRVWVCHLAPLSSAAQIRGSPPQTAQMAVPR